LPAPKVFEGNSNATANNAAMAGKNFMRPILKRGPLD
jgi:hypothetical protein